MPTKVGRGTGSSHALTSWRGLTTCLPGFCRSSMRRTFAKRHKLPVDYNTSPTCMELLLFTVIGRRFRSLKTRLCLTSKMEFLFNNPHSPSLFLNSRKMKTKPPIPEIPIYLSTWSRLAIPQWPRGSSQFNPSLPRTGRYDGQLSKSSTGRTAGHSLK